MNIGIVLSGGMAKGAYQLGALKALNNFIPLSDVKCLSCASIGVLNGYAYASNKLYLAENLWRNFCSDGNRSFITKVLKSNTLQQCITSIGESHEPLTADFYTALLDLNRRNIVYKNLSSVDPNLIPLYLKASVAMPIYNRSVQIDDTSYYDGAMVDNIPVFPMLNHELDYVVCIYFDDAYYKFEDSDFDNKTIKITFPCENLLRQSLIFRQDKIMEMIESGYLITTDILKNVFAEGSDNLEYIYGKIQELNQNKSSKLRITGDVLVTNLNIITKKLTKRKVL